MSSTSSTTPSPTTTTDTTPDSSFPTVNYIIIGICGGMVVIAIILAEIYVLKKRKRISTMGNQQSSKRIEDGKAKNEGNEMIKNPSVLATFSRYYVQRQQDIRQTLGRTVRPQPPNDSNPNKPPETLNTLSNNNNLLT